MDLESESVASGNVSDVELENESDLQPGSSKRYKPSSSGGDGGIVHNMASKASDAFTQVNYQS